MFWIFCGQSNTKPINMPRKSDDPENIGEILINEISVISKSFAGDCIF